MQDKMHVVHCLKIKFMTKICFTMIKKSNVHALYGLRYIRHNLSTEPLSAFKANTRFWRTGDLHCLSVTEKTNLVFTETEINTFDYKDIL